MLALAQALERGSFRGPVARAMARAWGGAYGAGIASVVRPVAFPPSLPVLAVGGATLGGSGKTPLALACAKLLASHGARVVIVGHAYRARPRRPRAVNVSEREPDRVEEVGDEAIVCARALLPFGGRAAVVVAPRRAEAVAFAIRALRPDVLILDGVLQTAPARASLSILAVDRVAPWGSGSLPPCGDLRAPPSALRAACDFVVLVGDPDPGAPADGAFAATVASRGCHVGGDLISWHDLKGLRAELFCALARPDRMLRMLARRGVFPERIIRVNDHGPLPPSQLRTLQSWPGEASHTSQASQASQASVWGRVGGAELLLASAKCSVHLPPMAGRVAVIDHALELSTPLRRRVLGLRGGLRGRDADEAKT